MLIDAIEYALIQPRPEWKHMLSGADSLFHATMRPNMISDTAVAPGQRIDGGRTRETPRNITVLHTEGMDG